jgi:hypothetical protein
MGGNLELYSGSRDRKHNRTVGHDRTDGIRIPIPLFTRKREEVVYAPSQLFHEQGIPSNQQIGFAARCIELGGLLKSRTDCARPS